MLHTTEPAAGNNPEIIYSTENDQEAHTTMNLPTVYDNAQSPNNYSAERSTFNATGSKYFSKQSSIGAHNSEILQILQEHNLPNSLRQTPIKQIQTADIIPDVIINSISPHTNRINQQRTSAFPTTPNSDHRFTNINHIHCMSLRNTPSLSRLDKESETPENMNERLMHINSLDQRKLPLMNQFERTGPLIDETTFSILDVRRMATHKIGKSYQVSNNPSFPSTVLEHRIQMKNSADEIIQELGPQSDQRGGLPLARARDSNIKVVSHAHLNKHQKNIKKANYHEQRALTLDMRNPSESSSKDVILVESPALLSSDMSSFQSHIMKPTFVQTEKSQKRKEKLAALLKNKKTEKDEENPTEEGAEEVVLNHVPHPNLIIPVSQYSITDNKTPQSEKGWGNVIYSKTHSISSSMNLNLIETPISQYDGPQKKNQEDERKKYSNNLERKVERIPSIREITELSSINTERGASLDLQKQTISRDSSHQQLIRASKNFSMKNLHKAKVPKIQPNLSENVTLTNNSKIFGVAKNESILSPLRRSSNYKKQRNTSSVDPQLHLPMSYTPNFISAKGSFDENTARFQPATTKAPNEIKQSDRNSIKEKDQSSSVISKLGSRVLRYYELCNFSKVKYFEVNEKSRVKILVELLEMGFRDEKIERIIFKTNVTSVEECMEYLIPEDYLWNHKFIKSENVNHAIPQYCIFCQKQKQADIIKRHEIPSRGKRTVLLENPKMLESLAQNRTILLKGIDPNSAINFSEIRRKELARKASIEFSHCNSSFHAIDTEIHDPKITRGNSYCIRSHSIDTNQKDILPCLTRGGMLHDRQHSCGDARTPKARTTSHKRHFSLQAPETHKLLSLDFQEEESKVIYGPLNSPPKRRRKNDSIIGNTYCGSELKEELCEVCLEPLEIHAMEYNMELLNFFFQFDDVLMGTAQQDILVTESMREIIKREKKEYQSLGSYHDYLNLKHRSNSRSIYNHADLAFLKLNVDQKSKNSIHIYQNKSYFLSSLKRNNKFLSQQLPYSINDEEEAWWNNWPPPREKEFCPICYEIFTNANTIDDDRIVDKITLKCKHYICKACLRKYIHNSLLYKVRVDLFNVNKIKCPIFECKEYLDDPIISTHSSAEDFNKFLDFKQEIQLFKSIIEKKEKPWNYCPRCSTINKSTHNMKSKPSSFKSPRVGPATIGKYIKCKKCKYSFCIKCGNESHPNYSCSEILEKQYSLGAKGKSLQLCPYCRDKIFKAQECNHMVCNRCLFSFCILCRKRYTPNHLNPFNPYGCTNLHTKGRKALLWTAEKKNIGKCRLLLYLLITLFVIPFLSLIILPLIISLNLYSNLALNDQKKIDKKYQEEDERIETEIKGSSFFKPNINKTHSSNSQVIMDTSTAALKPKKQAEVCPTTLPAKNLKIAQKNEESKSPQKTIKSNKVDSLEKEWNSPEELPNISSISNTDLQHQANLLNESNRTRSHVFQMSEIRRRMKALNVYGYDTQCNCYKCKRIFISTALFIVLFLLSPITLGLMLLFWVCYFCWTIIKPNPKIPV